MTSRLIDRYLTAARYALLEQARNRLALGLLVAFVPIWYWVGYAFTVPSEVVAFRFRVTDHSLLVNARQLTLLTIGLNAITLIVGFMLFTATRKDMAFDRRLVLAGYPQSLLIIARLTALIAVAILVSLYAAGVLFLFWHPGQPDALLPVWLGFLCAALSYGGLGLLLGVLVPGELAGFFLIIMVSLIDTFIQNPIGNPTANQEVVKAFPAFAPMQVAVAGGFTHLLPWAYVLTALAWPIGFALIGLGILAWKTRAWSVHAASIPGPLSHRDPSP